MINSQASNISNGGMVAKYHDKIFFTDIERHNGIFMLTDNNIKKIYDRIGCFFNISDGSLYFLDRGKTNKVMKYDIDNDRLTCVFEKSMWYVYIVADTMFYIEENNFYLNKINLNGANRTQITDGACYTFHINNNKLFFSQEGGIYEADIDGKNKKKISDRQAKEILAFENELYFIDKNNSNRLAKLSLDNGTEDLVTDFSVSSLNGADNSVFFLNAEENDNLFIMKTNANNYMKFVSEPIEFVNVLDDELIFCVNANGKDKIWHRLSTKGGRPVPLI